MRDVFKKGKQDQEDADNVRRELERIEKAALNSVGIADRMKHSSSTQSIPAARKTTDYYYANNPVIPTIEELRQGKSAKDLEQPTTTTTAAEGRDEWAVNKEIAKVGEWETVAQPIMPSSSSADYEPERNQQTTTTTTTTHDQRPEFQDDDEQDDDLNNFKIKEKELPIDPDDLPSQQDVVFKKRKLTSHDGEENGGLFKARKKKPLRKKN